MELVNSFRRRFHIECSACFAGTYHFDGIFNGAVRYRHCGRNDYWFVWIVDDYFDGWTFAGHPECKRCTAVKLGNSMKGREVNGIFEISEDGFLPEHNTDKSYGPYVFKWINDDRCS
jgi:hypothetical protein